MAAAAALFLANIAGPSLPSLDDCYYARKGVEMGRSGAVYTVTWNGQPTFQNPPLQFWVLGRSFAVFGENDGAARLPSALMALGLVLAVYAMGARIAGPAAGATATALVLATPLFANNARRCMLEIPLALWVVLALLVFVAGRDRPRLHLLIALPLGAGILTKSVLGLLPLAVIAGSMVDRDWRAGAKRPWLWLGVAGGLALGASWPLHQWWVHGPGALQEHFLSEIVGRSLQPIPLWRRLLGYPLLLLERFHPPVLLAVPGVVLIWKRWRREGDGRPLVIAAWIVVPLAAASLSSAQSLRYVFPLLPALALAAGIWLAQRLPRVAAVFRLMVAGLLVAAAGVFWLRPSLLRQPGNDVLKANAAVIRAQTGPGEPIAYAGGRYWTVANPTLYYAERLVDRPSAGVPEAVRAATTRPGRLLMLDTPLVGELTARGVPHDPVLSDRDWALVRIGP